MGVALVKRANTAMSEYANHSGYWHTDIRFVTGAKTHICLTCLWRYASPTTTITTSMSRTPSATEMSARRRLRFWQASLSWATHLHLLWLFWNMISRLSTESSMYKLQPTGRFAPTWILRKGRHHIRSLGKENCTHYWSTLLCSIASFSVISLQNCCITTSSLC